MIECEGKIKVMISSRCESSTIKLGAETVILTELRRRIKALVTGLVPFGGPLFDCWICEDSPGDGGSADTWEVCLHRIQSADIILVLYNGDPGWGVPGGIGICHAELMRGLQSKGIEKVPIIKIPPSNNDKEQTSEEKARHERFRNYYEGQDPFVVIAENGDEVLEAVPKILHRVLVQSTTLNTGKRRFDLGDALDWSRLNFENRKDKIEQVVRDVLVKKDGLQSESSLIYVLVRGINLLFLTHAIPAAVTNATAREMVGRPFHRDYIYSSALDDSKGGPVHIFACHRGVTERQAMNLLGQPDVFTVDTTFGVFAVDHISKTQCLFLRNCRDEASTRHAVQRAFDWLRRSGEEQLLAERGLARSRIIKTIANEQVHL